MTRNTLTAQQLEIAIGFACRCLNHAILHQKAADYYAKRTANVILFLEMIFTLILVVSFILDSTRIAIIAGCFVVKACCIFYFTNNVVTSHSTSRAKFFRLAEYCLRLWKHNDGDISIIPEEYDACVSAAPLIPPLIIENFIKRD